MKLLAAESSGKIVIANNNAVEPPDLTEKPPGNYVAVKKDGSGNVTHVYENGETGAARRVFFVVKE